MLLPAFQKGAALVADMAAIPTDDTALHVWWLGQSGFLLQQGGARCLIDPYLSDSLTAKYATTDKPHVRMTERCIRPEDLLGVELVLSSHQHTDHFDEATLRPLTEGNPGLRLVVPAAVETAARQRLPDAEICWEPLLDGQTRSLNGWDVTGVAAAHNEIERDGCGRCKFLGFVIRRGGFCVYHSGDTLLHPGLEVVLRPLRPDLVLLPINGNKPERRVAGNMDGAEAASLASAVGAGLAVPHHFEMFEFNTADPSLFVQSCEVRGQAYRVMRSGERLTLAAILG